MKNHFTLLVALLLAGPFAARAQNVGIGTPTPSQTLDVNGQLRVRGLSSPDSRLLLTQPDGTLVPSGQLSAQAGLGPGSTPVTDAVFPLSIRLVSMVATAGNYLYALNSTQLQVYDISNPVRLVATGPPVTLRPQYPALTLAVSGGYAYVGTAGGLDVYQITAPATLTYLTTVAVPAAPTTFLDMQLFGRYLYAVNSSRNVIVYDLANPASPVLGAVLAGAGSALNATLAVDVDKKLLYLYTSAAAYMKVYSLAAPATPALLTPNSSSSLIQAYGFATTGGTLLVGTDYNAVAAPYFISVYDVTQATTNNLAQPPLLGTLTISFPVNYITIKGRYGYLLGYTNAGSQVAVYQVAAPAFLSFDAAGNVASTAIPTPPADNLGNHTATQNLNLAGYQLVGNGGSSGLSIGSTGAVTTAGAVAVGGSLTTVGSLTTGGSITTGGPLTTSGSITAGGNVSLAGYQLVGNGGASGLSIGSTGAVTLAAGLSLPFRTVNQVAGSYQNVLLTDADHTVRSGSPSGVSGAPVFSFLLPTPSGRAGRVYVLLNYGATPANLYTNFIDPTLVYDDASGAVLQVLPQSRLTLQSNGALWLVLAR